MDEKRELYIDILTCIFIAATKQTFKTQADNKYGDVNVSLQITEP